MSNDLLNYPFIADVWGSVSDWVMVVVTAITAVLLYITLQKQATVTRIEQEIFRLNIKPEVTMQLIPINEVDLSEIEFHLSIENSDVFGLKIDLTHQHEDFNITWIKCFMHPTNFQKGTIQATQCKYSGELNPALVVDMNLLFAKATFKDAMGNEYEKCFSAYLGLHQENQPATLVKRATTFTLNN